MQITGFQPSDLRRFSQVQKLAYEVVEAVQARLETGMTEKDAVRMLRAELASRGVTNMFHDPFAWFGERAAFKNFWINLKFLPSKTRLEPGMPVILDIAPIVDGYSADIGYCFVHGGDKVVEAMDRTLLQVRDHIVQAVRAGKTMRAIYLEVDAIIEGAGFINVHRYYPHRVIGHRLGRIQVGALHKLRWLGFGLPTYVKLTSRTWLAKLFPKRDRVAAVERRPRVRPSGARRRVGGRAAHRYAGSAPGQQVGGDPGRDQGQRLVAERRRHPLPPRRRRRLVDEPAPACHRSTGGRLRRRPARPGDGQAGLGCPSIPTCPARTRRAGSHSHATTGGIE